MFEKFKEISVGVGLDDSEWMIYDYNSEEDHIKLKIETWNAKILEIHFYKILFWMEKSYRDISKFGLNTTPSPLFDEALSEYYKGTVPDKQSYKYFQFLDEINNPVIDIICEKFEYRLYETNKIK